MSRTRTTCNYVAIVAGRAVTHTDLIFEDVLVLDDNRALINDQCLIKTPKLF
jgi:hypothetical protein